MNPAELINQQLKQYNVKVKFIRKAFDDLLSFDKGEQKVIIASIIRRGQQGPCIKPHGLGDPLRGELSGFTKITLRKQGIRIVYKPRKNTLIEMGIIVIGPRKNKIVYKSAIKRLDSFNDDIP